MSLHINKNRDNINEEFIEHDLPESLIPDWFAPPSSKVLSVLSEPSSNLIWHCFE